MGKNIKIGLEVHVQLSTKTKLFCSCPIDWQAPPNTLVCPVCLGMPGTLPTVNESAVKLAIKTGLALNCKIHKKSIFERKNYFYPDLPKGYQITQYKEPLATGGWIDIGEKKIKITRVHLEEDAGKLLHEGKYSIVDFNRCGVPLIEIVTHPVFCDSKEVILYLTALRSLLRYIGVSSCDMEKGHLRCEPNISYKGGGRVEIKNLNSFKSVEKAIEYEINYLTHLKRKRGAVTLLWDETIGKTREMRIKEEAEDYRYFPEPDLLPLIIKEDWIIKIKKEIPELPEEKKKRFIKEYKIREYDATILAKNKELADYYEEVVQYSNAPQKSANFIITEVLRILKKEKIKPKEIGVSTKELGKLIDYIRRKVISMNVGKEVFEKMRRSKKSAQKIIEEIGIKGEYEEEKLREIVNKVLSSYPTEVAKYRKGKIGLLGFFIGEVIKLTGKKAPPQIVKKIIEEMISSLN